MKTLPRPRLQVKALLLDLDGTLVDSTEALKEAGRAGFAALGLSGFNDDKVAVEVARRLEQDLPIDDLFSKFQVSKEIEGLFLPAYLNAYYSAVMFKSKLFPETKEALHVLSKHFPLALITLRYVVREQIIDELKHLGLEKFFRVVVTTLDVEKPKPYPDSLIVAAQKLRAPIHTCAVVGDSVVDIKAGKAAGAKTIAVTTGLFTLKELKAQKPDLIIENITALQKYVSTME